jgi:hypothetical protein
MSNGEFLSFDSDTIYRTASNGTLLWSKEVGGANIECYAGQQTSDGGYALFGTMTGTANNDKMWLGKTNANGDMIWNKTYSGPGFTCGYTGQQTSDGGYILAGFTCPEGIVNDTFFLVKTDSNGSMEWNKTYGGPDGIGACYSVEQTSDGGYILAGGSLAGRYAWLVKTDSKGNMEWNQSYGSGYGGEACCVRQTSDGGYIFAGSACWYWNGVGTQYYDAWVVKTYSNGSAQWGDGYNIAAGSGWAYARSVAETSDGGYIATGTVSIPNQPKDSGVFLLKTHSQDSGFDWYGVYNVGSGSCVIQASDGGYVVGGGFKTVPELPIVARFRCSPNNPVFKENILFNASYSYDRSQDIVSYLWNFGDGNSSLTTNPVIAHRYRSAGIYNVSLTIVDAQSLNSSYSMMLCAMMPTYISISTYCPSMQSGYSVNITGTLVDANMNPLRNVTVNMSYTFSGFTNWTPIASESTNSLGDYNASWVPPAPSYFMLKAVYSGNYTHAGSSCDVSFSALPFGSQYVFSVESNSTISAMGFDNNTKTLSFTASGPSGTVGYTKVTIPQSLVLNVTQLQVYIDKAERNYTSTESFGSLVIVFAYNHSSHQVEVALNPTPVPEFPSFLILPLLMIALLVAAVIQRSKISRTRAARSSTMKREES